MNKTLVMIVEDSIVVREMLMHIVSSDPRLEVVSAVGSGEEALRALERTTPHVISLDIRLPGMDGFETTQKIMQTRPTPIVVISNDVDDHSLNISMNALRAGALAVLEKPPGLASADYDSVSRRICDQLVAMSTVKVVRQRLIRDLKLASASTNQVDRKIAPPLSSLFRTAHEQRFSILSLVASTGGPSALLQVLQALPPSFPIPIAIVQHITDSFLESFVSWLASESPFRAKIAKDREIPMPGTIYMAPVGHHLLVGLGELRLSTAEPVSMQRPSGTVLLQSMAQSHGPAGLGVVLTGMGDDGATGLLEVRKAGGYTIAEHESTAVVYGMPGVSERIGAACEMVPVDQIGARIVELVLPDATNGRVVADREVKNAKLAK